MTTTAVEMVKAANARIGHVTPAQAQAEIASGVATVASTSASPSSGSSTSRAPSRCHAASWSSRRIRPAPRHNPALDPDGRVIVYCRSGVRAALAAQTLQELGYTDVANLDGGIAAWKDAGLPLPNTTTSV